MTELERYKEAVEVLLDAVNELRHRGCVHHDRPEEIRYFADITRVKVSTILNPPPEMEEVEVVRYECATCGWVSGRVTDEVKECPCGTSQHKEFIKLTGTYKRPVPQKVEKSVSIKAKVADGSSALGPGDVAQCDDTFSFIDHPECHGKHGTLTFTWQE